MGKWSYSAGEYGATVRVYERTPGGMIYAATADGDGGEIRRSLGHRDKDKAKSYADREAAKLREGLDTLRGPRPTVARVLKLYLRHRTPDKSENVQKADRRQAELWQRVLGQKADLSKLSRREWDAFLRDRRSGAIDARGNPVPDTADCPACEGAGEPTCGRCEGEGEIDPRTPVSDRTVERDLRFLRAVCRWATEYRTSDGRLLLEADPTRGLEVPENRNPKRPVATHDRVEAIRQVYRDVTMRVERGGTRKQVESYLPEIFDLVVSTGRRISAVCGLRMEDLDRERTPKTPHGAIVWPSDTDKMDREWRCPLSETAREAVDRATRKRERVLGRVGPGPLFPAPGNPERAVRYEEASTWLREAEEAAGLDPLDGGLWHPFRRLWASSRKDLPDVDVAQAGGWSSLEALKLAYQHPDDETMLRVMEHEAELREVR